MNPEEVSKKLTNKEKYIMSACLYLGGPLMFYAIFGLYGAIFALGALMVAYAFGLYEIASRR